METIETMPIYQAYNNWEREKTHFNLNLKISRKLIELNKIACDDVFNKINSLAFFLLEEKYKKLSMQYLEDLTAIVNSFDTIANYFDAQRKFNIELSTYYNLPKEDDSRIGKSTSIIVVDEDNQKTRFPHLKIGDTVKVTTVGEDNKTQCPRINEDTLSQANRLLYTEQKAMYSMVSEIYRYGIMKGYKDKKITIQLKRLSESTSFHWCYTSKSDSEIEHFFDMKYSVVKQVLKQEEIFKIGMQDLYTFFDTKFPEYEPILFCNEILEHIFQERPKQKRYFTEPPNTTHTKIHFGKNEIHKISNMKNFIFEELL